MPFEGEMVIAVIQVVIGLLFGSGLVTLIFRQIFSRMKTHDENLTAAKKDFQERMDDLDEKKVDIAFCGRQSQECGRNFIRGEESFQRMHAEQQGLRKAMEKHGTQLATVIAKVDNLTYEVRQNGHGNKKGNHS